MQERTYGVSFLSSKNNHCYTYRAHEEYKKGEIVIVEARDSYSLGEIVEEMNLTKEYDGELKWIVCKCDFSKLAAAKAGEQKLKKGQCFAESDEIAKLFFNE